MVKPALAFALIAAASIVGYASYTQSNAPGADIRIPKVVFEKDQSRICPEDAPDAIAHTTGCEKGE